MNRQEQEVHFNRLKKEIIAGIMEAITIQKKLYPYYAGKPLYKLYAADCMNRIEVEKESLKMFANLKLSHGKVST